VTTSQDRALIAGGGIAGLAAAAALQLRGIPFVVFERRPDPPDRGLGLNLPGNAVVALQALGLGEPLEQIGTPVRRREYRNQRGRLMFGVDEDAFWGVEARPRCVIRSDLHAALQNIVAPEAIRLGTDVRGVQIRDAGIEVELGDGTVEDGGVLVAADGARSTIRAKAVSDRPPQAALLSRASWRFLTRNPGVDCWVAWTGARGTALLIPIGGDRVYGWVSVRKEELTDFAQVMAEFANFPPVVGDTLAAAQAEPVPPYHSPLEEVRPAAWTSGRVVLTGDAAHATAPVWAQGAGLAVEDGLVLADILAAADHWPDLGAEFARRRRKRVEHVQTMTDRLSRAATLPPRIRDLVLPLAGPRTYRATYGPLRDRGF
jgi:2-polyprenyl-6-methoxyphenol hydroxylase-like FAD-dependent oxidoreductase